MALVATTAYISCLYPFLAVSRAVVSKQPQKGGRESSPHMQVNVSQTLDFISAFVGNQWMAGI